MISIAAELAAMHPQTLRIYEAIPGRVLWTWVAEDFGTQESLLFSPQHIAELRQKGQQYFPRDGWFYVYGTQRTNSC